MAMNQVCGTDEYGNPVVVITVTGDHDIYRLHHNLMQAQIEFGDLARHAFVWMRKRMGAKSFQTLDDRLTSGFVTKHRWCWPHQEGI